MAKGSLLDDVVYYGLVAGVTYVGYTASLDGKLGPEAQKLAQTIKGWISGLTGGSSDPNLAATISRWQNERCAAGLDPNDWQAFRQYEAQRGYTTPEYSPPYWGYSCNPSFN